MINELPFDWIIDTLANRAIIKSGTTPSRSEPAYWEKGTIPWVKTGEIDYRVIHHTEEHITETALRETSLQQFPANTLLLAMYGQGVTRGKVAILGIDATVNQACAAITPRSPEAFDTEYVFYYLTYSYERLRAVSHGTQQQNLNARIIADFQIVLPPLPEQYRIALVLNTIQDSIAAQEDVITAARQFKRSLIQRLFTYGPEKQPAETHETEIGEVPIYWEVESIESIATVKSGTTPNRKIVEYWKDGTIPWVKTGEVDYCVIRSTEEYVTPLAFRDTSLQLYPVGTVLLAMYGQGITRGKVAILGIEATTNQACAALVPKNQTVSNLYLYHYLAFAYDRLRSKSHGTQQLNLNSQIIESFFIPIPPLPEQHKIVDLLSCVDNKIAAEEDRKTALQALFKSTLHQLMTGQIRLLSDEGLPL